MKRFTQKFGVLMLLMASTVASNAQFSEIQYFRKNDKTGRNVFETSKDDEVGYTGQKLRVGAGFSQSWQTMSHSNTAVLNQDGQNVNSIIPLGAGFGLASANLSFDAQLADGVHLNLDVYLASRHHNEAWVKGGYLQVDKVPFWNSSILDQIMEFTTVRAGHFEINYGDGHFRRTDGGKAIFNPFVENLIMDAFATEIAAEVEVKHSGWLGVVGLSNGRLKDDVFDTFNKVTNKKRSKNPSIYGKVGFDGLLADGWRFRLTESAYHNGGSTGNTLYNGDRTGSNYWGVLSPQTNLTSNFTTGRFNPGFAYQVTSFMTNLFTKYNGLEFFGTYEASRGRGYSDALEVQLPKRSVQQYSVDLLYYFGAKEDLYLGAKHNSLFGELDAASNDAKINRTALAAGYFFTKNIMLKAEYVWQNYEGFNMVNRGGEPVAKPIFGGKFDGLVIQAVIGF